jgi:hypothetical protein
MTHTITLVEQRVIFEEHMISSRKILRESCSGLTREQRLIIEGIYNESKPLIEASLTADQIQALFGEVEKTATAAGGNRTMLGKAVDIPGKVDDLVNKIGQYLQDTTPVKMADQKFEQLKAKVGAKFPELDKQLTGLGTWMKENPGKSAAIIGVLTTLAGLAGGPVGGAIAGQFLRGAAELIKGEKLSTAIGKGIKTAAYGFIAGKTFELIGDALSGGIASVTDNMFPNAQRLNFTRIFDEVGGPLGDRTATFQLRDLVGLPEDIGPIKNLAIQASDAWKDGNYELSKTLWDQVKGGVEAMNSGEYVLQLAQNKEAQDLARQGMKAVTILADFMGAAAQGAVAAGVGSKDGAKPAAKESLYIQTRPLSEGQVYLVFNRIEQLNEGPMDWIKKKAGNLTTKVTADKLNSAWKAAGSPTDSNEIAAFLEKQGVSADVVSQTFTAMKLPAPGSSAAAAAPAVDIEAVKKMIASLPVDRKARLLKYLQKNADKATPAAEPATPAATPTDPARDAGGGRIEPTMA